MLSCGNIFFVHCPLPTACRSGVGLFPSSSCAVFFCPSWFQCEDFSLIGLTLHRGRCASLKQNISFFSCDLFIDFLSSKLSTAPLMKC